MRKSLTFLVIFICCLILAKVFGSEPLDSRKAMDLENVEHYLKVKVDVVNCF